MPVTTVVSDGMHGGRSCCCYEFGDIGDISLSVCACGGGRGGEGGLI